MRVERVRLAVDPVEREIDADRRPRGADARVDLVGALADRRIWLRDRNGGRCLRAGRSGLSWNGCQLTTGRTWGSRAANKRKRLAQPAASDEAPRADDVGNDVDRHCALGVAAVMRSRPSAAHAPLCPSPRAPARDNGGRVEPPIAHAPNPPLGHLLPGRRQLRRRRRLLAPRAAARGRARAGRDAVAGRPSRPRADRARHRSGARSRSRRQA